MVKTIVGRHRPKAVIRPNFQYYDDKAEEQRPKLSHLRSIQNVLIQEDGGVCISKRPRRLIKLGRRDA